MDICLASVGGPLWKGLCQNVQLFYCLIFLYRQGHICQMGLSSFKIQMQKNWISPPQTIRFAK